LWKTRRFCWDWFVKEMEAIKAEASIDLAIVMGDCIDGKGVKSGGTELLTADRFEQCDMATAVIEQADAKAIVMCYGTPYHSGLSEDWEDAVAKAVNAKKIGGHDFVDVNGLIISYKHFVGASSVPYGPFTPLAKARFWNLIWAEHDEYPKADVILRAHVHQFLHCGTPDYTCFVVPALQGYGSKFGSRKPEKKVDFGLLPLDIKGKNDFSWKEKILKFRRATKHALKI